MSFMSYKRLDLSSKKFTGHRGVKEDKSRGKKLQRTKDAIHIYSEGDVVWKSLKLQAEASKM